ncbi:outer membrane protein assembly factor BamE [Paucibacter sp. KBW04]|uniref:outer membrane protein assembly factor BamE n=1 Tax=Paucibacter sp. KBW04 TaxID=2153361 RepID=UPI000F56086B|nr:outer membrane protein assembly factor BamE [Paucibacter sp. KBW04]RQO60627.1 outer membrane protein assembly factor BamE [Paucibacter sp. KBW04]
MQIKTVHARLAPLLLMLWLCLAGCDQQRADKLNEGVSTEADVRQQFGEPAQITERADGSKVLAYPRQPEGSTNYEIIIGADGKMSSLRQLLAPHNFAKIQPGMTQAEVSQILGRHAKTHRYALKPDEEEWEWRYLDGQSRKIFSVKFDREHKVQSSASTDDPRVLEGG